MFEWLKRQLQPQSAPRQFAGNAVESVGDFFGLPEGTMSETIAGGPTRGTDMRLVSKAMGWEDPTNSSPGGAVQIGSPDASGMAKFSDGSTRYVGGGNGGNPTGGQPTGGNPVGGQPDNTIRTPDFNALREIARNTYNEGLRRAGAAFDRARGLFDEGIQTLGKKRGEFKTTYDTGNNDILTSYEGSRGNLQSSAKNAATKSANLIRAMGLGGSAILRSEGQQKQDQARQLGSLNVEKTANERENLKQFNANQDWANLQESSLNRGLRDAQEARTAAENQAGLIEAGDYQTINERMGNYLNTILQNQLALDAANSGVASKAVNPYAVNISDMVDSLSAAVPTIGGQGGANGVQNVNIDPNNLTAEQLKKLVLSGASGARSYK